MTWTFPGGVLAAGFCLLLTATDPDQLLQRARTADGAALGRLLELHRRYLALLARVQIGRRLQGKVDPEDLVQETFLEAHRNFGRFRGTTQAEFVSWLRQILAANLAMLLRRFWARAAAMSAWNATWLWSWTSPRASWTQGCSPAPARGGGAGRQAVAALQERGPSRSPLASSAYRAGLLRGLRARHPLLRHAIDRRSDSRGGHPSAAPPG